MNDTPGPGRIEFIHALRGIAPILVLWAHLGAWWPIEHGINWELHAASVAWVMVPMKMYQDGGHLGVIIFFLISGYIITHVSSRERASVFLTRRFFRIFPLMAAAVLLSIGVSIFMSWANLPPSIGVKSTSLRDGIYNILLMPWITGTPYALSVTWTLFVEVLFYFLVAMTLPFCARSPIAATIALLTISTAIAIGVLVKFLPSYANPVIYLPILIAGRCIYFAKNSYNRRWVALTAICWAVFLATFELSSPGLLFRGPTPPIYTYVYAMIAFVGAMSLNIRQTWTPLRFLADTSYSMYLLHLPLGSLLLGLAISAGMSFSLAVACAAPILFALCWCSWTLIERPTANLGRALSSRTTAE